MSIFEISCIPANRDNYVYTIKNTTTHEYIMFDTSDFPSIASEVNDKLVSIFLTHRHYDHTDAVEPILEKFPHVKTYAGAEFKTFPVDNLLTDGQEVEVLGGVTIKTLLTPGHTLEAVCFLVSFNDDDSQFLFTGDTLFSMGCGGMFDGRIADVYWKSLQKILDLPDDVLVFASHEYTMANVTFLKTIDGDNPQLVEFEKELQEKLEQNGTSFPSTIKLEKELNPFLRCADPKFKQLIGLDAETEESEVFSIVRFKKSHFIVK